MTGRLALAVAAFAGVAHAEPRPPGPGDARRIVAVLEVTVTGVPDEVKQQFQSGLDAQVDPKRFWIAPRSWVRDKMMTSTKWTEGCVVGACLAELKAQTRADFALLVALTGASTSFGSVVTLVRTDTGAVLSQRSERCDVCTINEALATATIATIHLLDAVPDELPDEAADRAAEITAAIDPMRTQLVEQQHRRSHLGIGLAVAGLVVAAAGAALYFADHHSDYGAALAIGGGGLAGGGVVVLAF